MDLHKNDLSDIIKSLSEIDTFHPQQFDFLICTLGFESRTHNIIKLLAEKDLLRNTKIILIKYPTNEIENEHNFSEFEKAAKGAKELVILSYSRESILAKIKKTLENDNFKNSSVAFDISTCSSYVFYPVMHFLINSNIKLKILYTEAVIYHPTLEDWKAVEHKAAKEESLFIESFEKAEFQSIGIQDIYNSPLFSEMNPGNHPSILLLFPNFNPRRVNAIIEKDRDFNKTTYENIFWFIGEPPHELNKWRLDAVKKTNRLKDVKQENLVYVSTLLYKEVIEKLEELWLKHKYKYHISIGALGSKMQHLGVFFFNYLHEDIGLWLVEPIKFQASLFSEGSTKTHEINFQDTKELRKALEKYLKFEYSL